MNTRISSLIAAAAILSGVLVYTACSSDDSAVTEPKADAGSSSGDLSSSGQSSSGNNTLPDGGKVDCFLPPYTNQFQIINACTDADEIDVPQTKSSKLYADGGVAPLH
jgi:hypothetical protein